jgi:micrococcal nuclease
VRVLTLSCLVLALTASTGQAAEPAAGVKVLAATVTRVLDGDSLEVTLETGKSRVRLSGVDTPEYDQPYGEQSSVAMKALVAVGAKVELEVVTQDAFKRIVAVVWLLADGKRTNVNEWLLREGHGWAFRRYLTTPTYCDFEEEARKARRGLWAQPTEQWVYPPEWRFLKNGEIRTLPATYVETREKCLEVMKLAGAATYTPPS